MLTLCQLPIEVLKNIEFRTWELPSIVLVNHLFYDVYIPRLYEDFEHTCVQVDDPRKERLEAFLWAIFTFPRLAGYVKSAKIYDDWRKWLTGTLDDCDPMKYPSPLARYVDGNGDLKNLPSLLAGDTPPREPNTYGVLDFILARLPQLEIASIELVEDVRLLQLPKCTQLKELTLSHQYGTPMALVAAALRLPQLTQLEFVLEDKADITQLASVPRRSSHVQSLMMKATPEPWSSANTGIDLTLLFSTLFGTLKTLDHVFWERHEKVFCELESSGDCTTYHNACMPAALAPFKDCIGSFQIWPVQPIRRCTSSKTDLLESFRDYKNLQGLEFAPEMILKEPSVTSSFQDRSVSYLERSPGFFARLLPSSLVTLTLHADEKCSYRHSTYWLSLIKDILSEHKRLTSLRQIFIHQNCESRHDPCGICMKARESCGLCIPCDNYYAMRELCRNANILLKIERGRVDDWWWRLEPEDLESESDTDSSA